MFCSDQATISSCFDNFCSHYLPSSCLETFHFKIFCCAFPALMQNFCAHYQASQSIVHRILTICVYEDPSDKTHLGTLLNEFRGTSVSWSLTKFELCELLVWWDDRKLKQRKAPGHSVVAHTWRKVCQTHRNLFDFCSVLLLTTTCMSICSLDCPSCTNRLTKNGSVAGS